MTDQSTSTQSEMFDYLKDRRKRISADEDAQFDKLVADLIAPYKCEVGPPRAIAPNDQLYVEIVSSRTGAFAEGPWHGWDTVHFSLSAAFADWSSKMRTYLDGKSHVWWRIVPEFDVQKMGVWVWDVDHPDFMKRMPDGTLGSPTVPRPQYKIYARLMAE